MLEFVLHKGNILGGHKIKYDEDQLREFFSMVKSYSTENVFNKILKEYVKDKTKITKTEIQRIALLLLKKPELRTYFKQYAAAYDGRDIVDVMTYDEWSLFLQEVQGDKMDKRYFQEMLAQIKNPQAILGLPRLNMSSTLNFIEFSNIIFSDYNLTMDPQKDKIFEDMDRPLNEYFINSLHNTYYAGNQLTGSSSCMAYYEALKTGCRCIEIDTWDGTKGEPVVASEKNLASMIFFEDVIRCIAKWAFKYSEYPLLLFIENHCTIDQMVKMKKIMQTHFGDSIFRVSEKEFLNEKFPSPMKLRKKVEKDNFQIVIKTKSGYSHKKFNDKLIEKGDKKRDEFGRR